MAHTPFLDGQLLLQLEQAEGAQEAVPANSVLRCEETAVPLLIRRAISLIALAETLSGCRLK